MENIVNEYALNIRELLISHLNFLDGEVLKFVPTNNKEDTDVVKYTYYDYTSLFLEKMNAANLKYEYLQHEKAYIIYGYR